MTMITNLNPRWAIFNTALTQDAIKSVVSGRQAKDSIAERLAHYLKVSDQAGVEYKCFKEGAVKNQLESGKVSMDGKKAMVRIDGPLDWFFGVDVNRIIQDLDEAKPESIEMRINSPGGFLYDGLYLYQDLRKRAENGVEVTSLAQGVVGSAAVLPYLAADTRAMPEGTQIFTHKPYTMAFLAGNVDELQDQFDSLKESLDSATSAMTDIYTLRLDRTKDAVTELLSKDRWFGPEQAKTEGFANAEPSAVSDNPEPNDGEEAKYMEQAQNFLAAFQVNDFASRVIN